MPVPKIRLLRLRQALEPVVPLAARTQLVFPQAVQDAEQREEQHADVAAEVDRVAGRVLGRVGPDVGPTVEDRVSLARRERRSRGLDCGSYVATMPPIVPRVTTQLLDTARTAEPPESRVNNHISRRVQKKKAQCNKGTYCSSPSSGTQDRQGKHPS